MSSAEIIVLAGGKGTRMKSDLPKVLVPLLGRPMISYLLDTLKEVDILPTIVVGYEADLVKEKLGNDYTYVHQREQLGTGHAVMTAEDNLLPETKTVIVLYGDHPLVSAGMVKKLDEMKKESSSPLVMATTKVPDFEEWRGAFQRYGRIVRGKEGGIERNVEAKDASAEELQIREVNPSYFCFDRVWLFENLHALKNDNAQGEYYLTDLVGAAAEQGHTIHSIEIDPHEALGANTLEELKVLEKFL